jgi:glutamate synthase domain-containing protein 1
MLPQQKGHDNSGFAIVMKDLYGIFEPYKNIPLLSYSATFKGTAIIEAFMKEQGFSKPVFSWAPITKEFDDSYDFAKMDFYGFDVYDYPAHMAKASEKAKEEFLLDTRLALREVLEETDDGYVFSFWPDTLTLKEIGNPTHIGDYFNLWEEKEALLGKNIMIQYRQNTNYDIVRYAAHPFFLQGYTLCANGENTNYLKNKEFQQSLHRGYIGFESDSQCFLYTLHYTHRQLKWPLAYFKQVITPLQFDELATNPNKETLYKLRESLAHLEINGPNTVIGFLPDNTLFTACDSKKLRPVVVGSNGRMVGITSEVTGLNLILPDRNTEKDVYPNERETVVIGNDLRIERWKQQ